MWFFLSEIPVNIHTSWTLSKYVYLLGTIYIYWISIRTLTYTYAYYHNSTHIYVLVNIHTSCISIYIAKCQIVYVLITSYMCPCCIYCPHLKCVVNWFKLKYIMFFHSMFRLLSFNFSYTFVIFRNLVIFVKMQWWHGLYPREDIRACC